ncbi:MAG: tetratricopeptide repeat protein [Proteobacteria bacterium]|nr:tetratricopeptide repeat protein [Pseudomonadota bacterium]MDA1059142.1 tetratricopeptide repeat protein [Pseudomonadota bacterium]
MSDIFREVDEDLRQERYAKLWSRFGKYVIGAAVSVVVVAAVFITWQNVTESRRQAEGEQFAEALALARDGATAQAATAFNRLAENSGSGYRALARLQAAAALVKAGSVDDAVAAYDQLATDGSVDRILRDLGALLAALHRFDTANNEEMLQRLGPLVLDSNAWRYSAREMQALVYRRSGDTEQSRSLLQALADDQDAPNGIRSRAAELLGVIGGEG